MSALLMLVLGLTPASHAWSVSDAAPRKVIFDEDASGPGGSAQQAILMLLQSPDVDLLGITVPSGDEWRDEEVAHTLRLLEIARRTDVPVVPGAMHPLLNSQARIEAWERLYGQAFYLGAWTRKWPAEGTVRRTPYYSDPDHVPPLPEGQARIRPANEDAAHFLSRMVRKYPGQVTLIAAGPLTDLALAVRLDPQLPALTRELVFMGGSFNPVPAKNAFAAEYVNDPRHEFNFFWDPEAASIVLHAPWRKVTQVPVDPTTATLFSASLIHQVGRGSAPFDGFLGKYAQPYPMWDELAVGVWLKPEIVQRSESLLVDVDTSFTAGYGNTLSWPVGRGPGLGERPVEVVFAVDVRRFEQMTVRLLTSRSPSPQH